MNNHIFNIKSAITNHKYRRKIYFFILSLLLVLLASIFFLVKNEVTYHNHVELIKKNNSFIIKSEKELELLKDELYNSKEKFYGYLLNTNSKNYKEYFRSLDSINLKLGALFFLDTISSPNKYTKKIVKIDSVYKINKKRFINNPPKFNYYLNNLKIDSVTKVDSVKRKWFFGRLLDAILGRVNVEKVTTEIKTVKEYSKNINGEHFNEENNLEKKLLLKNRSNLIKFINLNNDLVENVESFLNTYKTDLMSFKNQNSIKSENLNNMLIKNSRLMSLLLLLLTSLLVVILYFLMKHTFNTEKRLIIEKEINNQHIIFKNKIISVFSHETKMPLSLITMFSEKLERVIDDDIEAREIFTSLKYSSNSLVSISKSIVESLKQNENKFQIETFNLKKELESIISILNYFVKQKNNHLIIKSDLNHLNYYVVGDRSKIQQLFYNIIGNSNKNTNEGDISITFKTICENDILNIEFEISDNGIGIPKKELSKVLLEDYVGENNKNRDDSNGLGLYLSKKIVNSFNGDISVKSKENIGTSMHFNMQLKIKK